MKMILRAGSFWHTTCSWAVIPWSLRLVWRFPILMLLRCSLYNILPLDAWNIPSPSFEIVCLVAVENAMEPTTPNRCIHRSSWWSLLGGLIINRCSHRFDPALAAQASSDCHRTSSGPICSTLAVVFSMALERSCLLALFGAVWIYFLVARFLGQVVEICGNHWFTWLDLLGAISSYFSLFIERKLRSIQENHQTSRHIKTQISKWLGPKMV